MRDEVDLEGGPDEPDSQEFDLRPILDFLRRRRLLILLISVPLLIPATIFPFLAKHFYEATSTVAIHSTPKVLDFNADPLPGALGQAHTPQALESSMITLVYSDAVLGQVIDLLPKGSEPLRRSVLDYAKALVNGSDSESWHITPEQERALRIESLRGNLDVQLAGGGSFLRIKAVSDNPAGATFLANSVADSYVRYLQSEKDEGSRRAMTFLNQQIYDLRQQIADKESASAELVAKNQVSPSALSNGSDGEGSSLSIVDSSLQTARIELVAARQRLTEMSPRMSSATTDSNQDRDLKRTREEYQSALAALESARLRFTPTHPEVQRLENVVASLAKQLGAAGVRDARPLSAAEEAEYQSLRAEVSRLDAKVHALEKAREDMVGDGGAKSEAVSRYKRLQSELEVDQQMLEVLLTRRNESLLTAADKQSGATVLDYAIAPLWPAGPSRRKYLLLGWGAALAAGLAAAVLRELLDRRVRDTDTVARALGAQTLGMIPHVEDKKVVPEHQTNAALGSAASEGYRNLRTSILFAMRNLKLHSILVTSAIAGEGKTTTSINLSSAFARMGRRVILIDADLRRARVDRVFGIPRAPGLSEVLQGKARLDDCIQRPENSNFEVLTAGDTPENPSELLASNAFAQVMADLKSEYELVVLDSPVLLAVPDALLLAADADGTLLVHKPGSVELRALRRMREDLRRAGARVLGVVFNRVDPSDPVVYSTYMASPYLEHGSKRTKSTPRA
ncbi:MAG TPA: polysaccharide biosynthesis tyrosine autokinase [Myxococcota bacterium]|nr:polysaccharide biosynthesis tyrosine autokinase [Myxococcota bacterium]